MFNPDTEVLHTLRQRLEIAVARTKQGLLAEEKNLKKTGVSKDPFSLLGRQQLLADDLLFTTYPPLTRPSRKSIASTDLCTLTSDKASLKSTEDLAVQCVLNSQQSETSVVDVHIKFKERDLAR